MSTNGTDGAAVSLHHLALEAWINRNQRPASIADDGVFACFLRTRKSSQVYRYLRKWLADEWEKDSLVSYTNFARSLSEEVILSRIKGKNLDDLTRIVTKAQNAKSDLNRAFEEYRELLSHEASRENRHTGADRCGAREDGESVIPTGETKLSTGRRRNGSNDCQESEEGSTSTGSDPKRIGSRKSKTSTRKEGVNQ